ncbi:MAG: hypothetical protein IT160_17810 [Bryobacterales bacterium]|nr:hypothetical protein [Bryobacterales bacterium]
MTSRELSLVMALAFAYPPISAADVLDLAPFAHPCCVGDRWMGQTRFEYGVPPGLQPASGGRWIYGLQWAEERDISTVLVHLGSPFDSSSVRLEYWSENWPHKPPAMPTIEDPVDDPWQGKWIVAKARISCEERECTIGFFPLAADENPRATNLPGVTYRRTVKFRVVFAHRPQVESVQVFSETTGRRMQVRVRARYRDFHAYNGRILKVTPLAGGAELDLVATTPAPAGSNDVTVIEVRNGDRSFAFAPADLDRGPIYVRAYDAFVTLATDTARFSTSLVDYKAGIRERLAAEPEQSYERASREIPPLDPVRRQGRPLYLPLAADASWQKFALAWGGHVWISKRATKAFGNELKRLAWTGDRIEWRLGTGATPWFRPEAEDSRLAVLEDYLPVAEASWEKDGLKYRQEAFATLLSGPLGPDEAGRSEQTPAVLLMRLRVKNPQQRAAAAHWWLAVNPGGPVAWENGLLVAQGDVRAAAQPPSGSQARVEMCADGDRRLAALHIERLVQPDGEAVATVAIPFIPGLTGAERKQLKQLDYDGERARVIAYWKGVASGKVPFEVPEERFNRFARAVLPHMRISVTKDPGSGLYMVPAASYDYRVFLNEAAFQSQLLDLYGEHALSAEYLETAVKLQGSKPMPGTYTGDQKAVYHGAKVDDEYDYTAHGYNLDHGTILWTLGEHYLLTRNKDWLRGVLPGMKRAAGWVTGQRQLTKAADGGRKCPEYGLLPAGHLEDNHDWGHWFAVNAYASAGMTRLAWILAQIGDPEAARYGADAAAYREDLRQAVLRAAARAPVIRLRDNTYAPYVPVQPHQRIRLFGPLRAAFYSRYRTGTLPTYRLSATREVLYGPMILLDTGIFNAHEPLADWVLSDWEDNATMSSTLGINPHGMVDEKLWFSRGGMVFQANLQNPVRTYLRRGEIPAAIRNLYNGFTACYYPTVNVFTEEFRQWRMPAGPFYKVPDEARFLARLRDALVMEYDGRLYLAAGTPRRWLEAGKRVVVRAAPTWYGPVSYEISSTAEVVTASVHLPRRNPAQEAVLSIRPPEGRDIAQILINGRPWHDFDGPTGRIRLPRGVLELRIEARLK